MTYHIVLTTQAKMDLRKIFKYIAFDLQSVQNVSSQIDRLEKAIASLDQMPERFRVYDKPKWRERNLRIMPVNNYLVFYIPDHNNKTVTILRVMYSGQDIESQLKNME